MKTKTDTIVRTVILVLALLNQALLLTGESKLPYTEEELYQYISILVTIGVAIWNWWKNNSFTEPAKQAEQYLQELKEEQKGKKQLTEAEEMEEEDNE